MKKTYFFHRDARAGERQSDGVEFCKIPEFYDGRIYFYCDQYQLFWTDFQDIGNLDLAQDFQLHGEMEPASLQDLAQANLLDLVDGAKQYHFQGRHLVDVHYMLFR